MKKYLAVFFVIGVIFRFLKIAIKQSNHIKGRYLLAVLLTLLIGIFLYYHLKVGLVRYLDLDETAHLHWAYDVFSGRLPYRDFLYIFTPFYLYFLAPILAFTGKSFAYVVWGRGLSFLIYMLAVVFLFFIAKKTKNTLFAFLTILIFVYLPLPFDKWIEIRPDGLGTMMSLVGTYLFIKSRKNYFAAGFFLFLSVAISPKNFLFPLSAMLALLVGGPGGMSLLVGGAIPILVLLLLFMYFGDLPRAIYSVFTFQKAAGDLIAQRYPMRADLYFYPNDVYYGWFGLNFNFFANLFIYFLASVTAIVRLVSAWTHKTREKKIHSLFLSLLLVANIVAYIKFFPLKHPQYLVAVSPLIAYFFVDFIFALFKSTIKKGWVYGKIFAVFFAIFLILMTVNGSKMYEKKASWTFTPSVSFLEKAKNTFKPAEYVWDLTGASLFYNDPYYICCLPYGDYIDAFAFNLPSLKVALAEHEVKYIFVQFPQRVFNLPVAHQKILAQYYVNIAGETAVLFVGKDISFDQNRKPQEFELIASGWYKIYINDMLASTDDVGRDLRLDGKIILSNPIFLGKETYSLSSLKDNITVKFVFAGD